MKRVGLALLLAAAVIVRPAAQARVTLITGGTVVTVDAAGTVIRNGAVAIQGERIAAVGTAAEMARRYPAAMRIDATGHVVMPGLVNTHGHAPMVLYRGLADDLALMDWLQQYIFPAEAKTVSADFVRVGTNLAALEMIESGTTTFADMYYFEEAIAAATKAAGLRAVLGQTIIQFPVADAKTWQEGLARAEAFVKQWRNDPLVTPAYAPHSMYTLDETMLKAIRASAEQHNAFVLIHLSETKVENDDSRKAHGVSPTQWLEQMGFWTSSGGRVRTLAAHGIWLDDADMATLAKRGVALSHNPESNMKLASGAAPVTKWLTAGIRAGLGTDGAASNNDLDMFESMRLASFLQKHANVDPRALPAKAALELATMGGARALGLDASIGSLEAGKLADVIVVGMSRARQTPVYDPVSHLVYATRGDDVRDVFVHGRVLMRDRLIRTLNRAAVLRDARAMQQKVKAAVAK
ncbi:MAG: amidohydrolase family protein [Acidobacteriota bacterium]|nr:amidohydrolase family protein [Acidobacteriota bacterium]MDQ3170984.1 amidohydrolase family protein [Acidobacteriota bacterium]